MADKHRKALDRIIDRATQTLTTLAATTGKLLSTNVNTQNFAPAAFQGCAGVNGFTTGEGPLLWGLMDGDYVLSELEEYLELQGPLNSGDKISKERSTRSIQVMGAIGGDGNPDWHQMTPVRLGKFREDIGWTVWVYNFGPAALTTGASCSVQSILFGRWID